MLKDFGMKGLYVCAVVKEGLESSDRKCVRAVSNSSKLGVELKSTSSFGTEVLQPKRSCEGEASVVFEGVLRQPRRTKGRAFVQFELVVSILSEAFRVLWNLSSIPLVCGWYAVEER